MDIKLIMEVIAKFVDEKGVLDQERLQEELETTLKDKDLTIDNIAKMSKDEIKENAAVIHKLLSELSQKEINDNWETIESVLKELGA